MDFSLVNLIGSGFARDVQDTLELCSKGGSSSDHVCLGVSSPRDLCVSFWRSDESLVSIFGLLCLCSQWVWLWEARFGCGSAVFTVLHLSRGWS